MTAALVLVNGQMSGIAASARSAANDMRYMVSAVNAVDQFLKTLQSTASNVLGAVANLFAEKSRTMNTTGVTTMRNLTGAVTNGTNAIKSTWTAGLSSISATTNSGAVTILATWTAVFTALATITRNRMNDMRTTIASGLRAIQSAFASTQLSFNQHVQLPHFTLSGIFDPRTGSVPSVSVAWYKRAATQGARFSNPTIIGVGDASQPELLIGETTLYEQISEAAGGGGDTIIPVYLGGDLIDTIIVKATQRSNYRSGGRS